MKNVVFVENFKKGGRSPGRQRKAATIFIIVAKQLSSCGARTRMCKKVYERRTWLKENGMDRNTWK